MEKLEGSVVYQSDGVNIEKALFTYDENEQQDNKINKENAKLIFKPKFIPYYPKLQEYGFDNTEILLYGFIDFYCSSGEGKFYFTNIQLSELLNVGETKISLSITKLEQIGIIKTNFKIKAGGGKIRFIQNSDFGKNKLPTFENQKSDFGKSKEIYNKINNNKMKDNKMKDNKIIYLEKVRLTENEYNSLIYDFGEKVIENKIWDLNEYIINKCKGKDPYSEHNLTIRKRIKKDGIKKKEHNEVKPNLGTDNFFTSLQKQIGQN